MSLKPFRGGSTPREPQLLRLSPPFSLARYLGPIQTLQPSMSVLLSSGVTHNPMNVLGLPVLTQLKSNNYICIAKIFDTTNADALRERYISLDYNKAKQ